jgi:hypothetical protein
MQTPEQRRRKKADAEKRRRARFTPEQKARDLEAKARYRARLTPEQIERYRVQNLSRIKERRESDPILRARVNAATKAWRIANPGKSRQSGWKKHGIRLDHSEFDHLHRSQSGLCRICGNPNTGKSLAVDHCHSTGRVRGLLCDACNRSLGVLGDTPAAIERVYRYVCGTL